MNKISTLLLLCLLTSCATDIDFHIPLNRFEGPETNGGFLKGDVGIKYGRSHKVTTAEVVEYMFPSIFDPTVSSDAAIEASGHLSSNFSLGLHKRFDFVFKSYGDGADVWGVKFQFLGESAAEEKEGWKGSIQATKGSMNEDEGSLNVSLASGGSRNYNGRIELETYDLSLNFGYRFNKYLITYLNSIYSYYDTTSTLTSNTFTTINVLGVARTYGGLLGLKFGQMGQHVSFTLETGLMHTSWEGSLSETTIPIGFGVDFNW
ncbi:hypothetical protein [Halobacteriovorax sp. JY17]|uniref:hypothetical protein n=1 Tax=Halobacteriovorax sp. JY17 TaxID=2014617 RepID=UPI000C5B00A3|nr:hypothetical protein [Halobacteriovorax sp. JY17]PIK14916.1 MAG: hypothetical protein CES88_11325 [Halobacteriovorax sp. JY17]